MLKHVSRFDYERFAWLLPLDVHRMVAMYCLAGIDAANFAFRYTEPVGEDVTCIDFDRDGQLMCATNENTKDPKIIILR